ncbi:MAG: hypothetical protein AMJ53_00115 [Gammaproteobacteria bacterium SG8_11]|nr:MAG: hypothetical protein AMJ53_00115 [Gammaproteobacteria bacterium SG8_11]
MIGKIKSIFLPAGQFSPVAKEVMNTAEEIRHNYEESQPNFFLISILQYYCISHENNHSILTEAIFHIPFIFRKRRELK